MAEDLTTETAPVILAPKQNPDVVMVKITKFGAGKVSTGMHVAGEGDIYASRDDVLTVSKTIADMLEAKGLAEAD